MKPCPSCGGDSSLMRERGWELRWRCQECLLRWNVDGYGKMMVLRPEGPGNPGWVTVPEGCLMTGKGEPE